MCLAGPRAAGPLRRLRDADLVEPRSRGRADVRRADGLRGAELGVEAADQGGKAQAYASLTLLLSRFFFPLSPLTGRTTEMYGKGYGMPSSHAQFVSFFSLYLALFLLLRHAPHPTHTHTPTTFAQRLGLSILAVAAAGAVAFSRIYLSYHTGKQVLVGCAAGAAFALVWFGFTTLLRRSGWLEWGLDTGLARALRMRDLVVEEDLVDAGWARWQDRRVKRGSDGASAGKKRR